MSVRERPAAGEAEAALVLFHGRGADENDLFPLLDALDPERRLDGYSPRGPLPLPPGGAHWYVVRERRLPRPGDVPPTYDQASEWLDSLPYERLVVGGFSQGTVMSFAVGLGRGRPRPEAIVAFSGFVPEVEGFALDLDPPLPPIAIAHGTYDPMIPVEFGRAARDLLAEAGADVPTASRRSRTRSTRRAVDDARQRLLGECSLREALEHREGAVVVAHLLEAVPLVEADGGGIVLDAQRDARVAVRARPLEQAVEQLLADALAAAAGDDRDRQLGRLLVDEAVARARPRGRGGTSRRRGGGRSSIAISAVSPLRPQPSM